MENEQRVYVLFFIGNDSYDGQVYKLISLHTSKEGAEKAKKEIEKRTPKYKYDYEFAGGHGDFDIEDYPLNK